MAAASYSDQSIVCASVLMAVTIWWTSTTGLASGSSPAIKTGNNVSNHVTIVAEGTTITVYVNSAYLFSVNNSAASSGGVAVMAVDVGTTTTTTGAFTILHD